MRADSAQAQGRLFRPVLYAASTLVAHAVSLTVLGDIVVQPRRGDALTVVGCGMLWVSALRHIAPRTTCGTGAASAPLAPCDTTRSCPQAGFGRRPAATQCSHRAMAAGRAQRRPSQSRYSFWR
jgi:hypothetical protein